MKIHFGKVGLVADSHYDYQLEVWKIHCPRIFRKPELITSFERDKLGRIKMDHLNTVIYFDRSTDTTYLNHDLDLSLIAHASQLSERVEQVWYVGREIYSTFDRKTGRPLWRVHHHLTEKGIIPIIGCEFKTGKIVDLKHDRSFRTIDWAQGLKLMQS